MAKRPIPAEIDPLKLAKDSVGQKKRENRNRLNRLKKQQKDAEEELKKAEAAEKVIKGEVGLITQDAIDDLPPNVQAHLNSDDVVFRPNPGPQTEFLSSTEDQVFYGGARGGGKSYALLVDPLYHCDKKNHRALILRRTMPELRDLIAKSQTLYKAAYPGAKWRDQEKEWRFPSGARIEFGYAENMLDVLRYQGQSYTWIGVDELPQFATSEVWTFLSSSLRSVDPAIKPVMRATGNPGNIGSSWVKEMFIDPAPPNTRFNIDVKATTPRGVIDTTISRKYIPATVFDNPFLTYDNSYIAMLASLPEMQRRQFLEGDWSAFDGAAFSDFRVDTHVYDPATFEIPTSWIRFRAADWGFTQPACCLWFAVDYDNNLYVYRELYTKGKNAEEFARLVNELEYNEPIRYGVLDSSTWARRGDTGPSIAETMIRAGCKWRPADRSPGSRKAGKLEIHRRLALKEFRVSDTEVEYRPSLFISRDCKNLLRTLPMLPLDKGNSEDVDTDADDHCFTADTLVDTSEGPIPITNLVGKEGLVYTFDGQLAPFQSARLTRRDASIIRLTFDDESVITCTPDHLIHSDTGWIKAEELLGKYVTTVKVPWKKSTYSATLSKNFVASDITSAANTSKEMVCVCTKKSGSITTEQFQSDTTSTTLMEIDTTTVHQTSWQCQRQNTSSTMNQSGHHTTALTSSTPLPQRQSGTEAMLGETGIKNIGTTVLENTLDTKFQCNAPYATKFTNAQSYLPTNPSIVGQTATKRRCVGVERLSEKQNVYCLSVPTTEAFSVNNGMIVHNCYDALRYGIMSRPISREMPFDMNNLNRTNDFQMADRVFGY